MADKSDPRGDDVPACNAAEDASPIDSLTIVDDETSSDSRAIDVRLPALTAWLGIALANPILIATGVMQAIFKWTIRDERDPLCARLDELEFGWEAESEAIHERLDETDQRMQHLAQLVETPRQQEHAALFEGPRRAPARAMPSFTGRTDKLIALERLLLSDMHEACVVTGLGGIGKTTLIQEFVATRARVVFPGGVAWLDGSELVRELGRAAERFGWSDKRQSTPEEAISLLGTTLHSRRFLLVVDNFDPEVDNSDNVPVPGGQCRTLITSRSLALSSRLDAAELELELWTINACREYLRACCPRLASTPNVEIDRIADFVGRLPLGIRLVVSVLEHRRSLKIPDVLSLLKQQQLNVLDSYDNRGVAATFDLGWSLLDDDARCILRTLAVCAQNTQTGTVKAVVNTQRANAKRRKRPLEDVQRRLDNLHVGGFVELTLDANGEAQWGLHDILRIFAHHQRPSPASFAHAHTRWVCEHLKAHTIHEGFTRELDEIRRAFERVVGRDWRLTTAIYHPLTRCLENLGRYSEALGIHNLLLTEAQTNNPNATATALTNLGCCYRKLGYTQKAMVVLRRSLVIKKEIGQTQGQANSLSNLGACYQSLGNLPEAIHYHKEALAIYVQHGDQGGEANETNNLGSCFHAQSDITRAIQFFERACEINETLKRPEGQLVALDNLGLCHHARGDLAQALHSYERALQIQSVVGGLDREAEVRAHLASCHLELGNLSAAIELFERVRVISKKTGSLIHYAESLAGLGVCYRDTDVARATKLLERAIKIEKVTRRDGSRGLKLMNLGLCYYRKGDYDEGIRLLEQSLEISEDGRVLGNLGLCYQAMGNLERSIELQTRALALAQEAGRIHNQAHHLANLGICYQTTHTANAVECFRQALDLYRNVGLPEDHPDLRRVVDALARLGARV